MTAGYSADRETVIELLNDALATSWYACCATGATTTWRRGSRRSRPEFLAHATEEQGTPIIAERIVQLGGEPDAPDGLARAATPSTSPARRSTT